MRGRTARALGAACLAALVCALGAPVASASFLQELGITFATDPSGTAATQAASHPFAWTTTTGVSATAEPATGKEFVDAEVKDLKYSFPPGLIASTTPVPFCSKADFAELTASQPACSDSSAVGTARVKIGRGGEPQTVEVPVYLLVPSPGEAVKLGFVAITVSVTVDAGLREVPPFNAYAASTNISQAAQLYSVELTVWGNPASPLHDTERGRCAGNTVGQSCPVALPEKPFLRLPTDCAGPLNTDVEADAWKEPGVWTPVEHVATVPGMSGCTHLNFAPTITARPTAEAATSPTGLDFSLDVEDEGLANPEGIADSDIEKAEVTLPEGMSINPSQAEGLAVCTEADLARETSQSAPGEGCPEASKVGTVEVESPLLEGALLKGSLFVATPYENPFHSLVALYIVIKDPELGINVVQPAEVTPNPVTGQLLTTTEEMPQLPFSHFRLHFKEGTRSPIVTPPACGSYSVNAKLYPYSGGAPVESSSAFQIITGPDEGPCPSGGTPPFHPGLIAGTINNAAGSYSPFDVRLFRTDSEQEITHFSIKLPPGVTGKLAGVPFCPDADIAAAKARERQPHGGQEELDHPSCPQASEIGHTLVGAGVGPSLTYVPGKVYMAGPYNGSNLSIVAITAAKAGPFDLGTVVVHEALRVNPETAEISVDAAGSDPIPHIVDGIPVHLRDIRVYVDRPEFMLNPTNCEPTSTASTVLGSGTDFATEADDRPITVTTRFQAADCASLGFRPRLKISLKGPTRRAGLPALTAVVTPRAGDANIGRAVVTLPRSEFLEQAHIGNSCTRVQFNAGAGNGAGCPANSVLGHAVAVTPLLSEPLEGPVFLRSNGGERKLPDLVAALHSKDIDIDLVGFIDSLHRKGSDVSRIRTTFAKVPDQPVTRFTLKMSGGKKGLLVNSRNLCKGKHRAISVFVGQNGRRDETRPVVKARCKKRGKRHRKAHGHSRRARQGGGHLLARRHGR